MLFMNKGDDIYVTGIGIISAIGKDVEENILSLLKGKTGIGDINYLPTVHKTDFVAGEVKYTNSELKTLSGLQVQPEISRTALLGIIAAKQAINNAGITKPLNNRIGLISATTVGGMDKSELYYHQYLDAEKLSNAIAHPCGYSTNLIAKATGITGYATTISTACSSSANAIITGARLIRNRILDTVVAGGTDAMSRFTLNGFNSLMILDNDICKPFDKNRKGLNLGEGAAFLVLESESSLANRKSEPLCVLSGYANRNDVYHQTASSPEGRGAFAAMREALDRSGLNAGDIDYINAHGTGTENNDLSEGIAIERLFGGNVKFSSTKAYTGHTLGAAGAIEAIFSVLALKHGIIPPNLNFHEKMNEIGIVPESQLINEIRVDRVLSNSFGFGGNNSSLIFSNVP